MFSEDETEAISNKARQLVDELRKVGIYADNASVLSHPSNPRPMVHITATIGDIAFSDRVQDPGMHDMRSNLREVERDIHRSALESERDDILSRGFFADDGTDGGPAEAVGQ